MNSASPLPKAKEVFCLAIAAECPEQANKTVLLVEDECFLRQVTCEVLESAGFTVLSARDSKTAMALFRRHRNTIDLLLSDVALPGGNGYDMAEEMRKTGPSLEVVLISGHIWNAVEKEELGERGMFYLPKPFSAVDLLSKVNSVLQASRPYI